MPATLITWDGLSASGNLLEWSPTLSWDGTLAQPPSPTMIHLRVLLDFTHSADLPTLERATNVKNKIYLATVPYPEPPVSAVDLQAGITAFTIALGSTEQGGTQATANKNLAKSQLVALLRSLANYVQDKHGNVLATLLLSGFDAASTNRTPEPLVTPNISKVLLRSKGVLKLLVPAVRNARGYDVRYALRDANGNIGPWTQLDNFLSTRELIISDLQSGGTYDFQVRATGGSTRESDWSNSVTAMSM